MRNRLLYRNVKTYIKIYINPLNTELNPICPLLALLVAHHILHVSRIKVKIFYTEGLKKRAN